MKAQQITHGLNQVAKQAVPDNLDHWQAIQARLQRVARKQGIAATPHLRPFWGRGILSVLIALGVMIALATTVAAIYYKIVVVEPSRPISGLDEAIRKADFLVWVYDGGELVRVSDLWADKDSYMIFLEYRLPDGRRFYLNEEKARPLIFPRDYDRSGILDENVDINGQKGLLSQNRQTTVINGEYRYSWQGPNLYWQAGGTTLRFEPRIDAVFSTEEIIAIARALHGAGH